MSGGGGIFFPPALERGRAAQTSDDFRETAARHENGFTAAHRRSATVLRAVDELFGPAAAEVLRRLFDDVGENASEAIDNLHRHAGLLRAELEDRRINEVGRAQSRASELAVENARLRQAGRRLVDQLEQVPEAGRLVQKRRRSAIASWRAEDPQ